MAAQPTGRTLGNCLPPFNLAPLIAGWLADDCPSLDVGGYVVGDVPEEAALLMKSDGVLAGTSFADEVFRQLGCTLEWHFGEGEALAPSASGPGKLRVATARGPARRLLLAERTALNTLARASGVASAARRALAVAKEVGWAGELAGTRKTTPGFRIVEKHALLVGGVSTHRLDLSQMVMLKDNHIWAAGSIPEAVAAARTACGFSAKIEVECSNLEDALSAAAAGADIVMLDNYTPARLAVDAPQVKAAHPHVLVEASGGITMATVRGFMLENVDVISQGAFTQGYDCVDFSLKLRPPPGL